MTTPDFNDLTPPADLIREAARGINSHANVADAAARWGARHGYEQARQHSLQEQAIAAADEALQPANLSFTLQDVHRLADALSLCRRALEQAGEVVE